MVTELIYHMVSSINMHYLQTIQMEQTKVFELRLRLRGLSLSVKFGKLALNLVPPYMHVVLYPSFVIHMQKPTTK